MHRTTIGLVILALGLCACATAQPKVAWVPRAGADLAADEAQCSAVADEKNINQVRDYADGRYGAAAAMASRLNQRQGRYGAEARLQDLIFDDCMVRKGWTKK